MIKAFTIACILFIASCSNHQIATNEIAVIDDFSLNQVELDRWLANKNAIKLLNEQQQIETFFIEKYLLKNTHILDNQQAEKTQFLFNANKHKKAIKYIKKHIKDGLKIDYQDVNKQVNIILEFNKNKTEKVRLYQIYKNYPSNATTADKQIIISKMRSIKNQIDNLDDFKKIAYTESVSQSRLKYGLIGNVSEGQLSKDINGTVMKMHKNQLSEVIIGNQGVVLFYCESRIPVKIRTRDEIESYVINTFNNNKVIKSYNIIENETLDENAININWQSIYADDLQKTSVVSKTNQLNNQQVLWLLNGSNNNKKIINYAKKSITNAINHYTVNLSYFNRLNDNQQNEINNISSHKLNEILASKVLAQMISNQLIVPTLKDEKIYYSQYKNDFVGEKHYDVSGIAFKLNDENKSQQYALSYTVLEKLNNNSISFNNASVEYSFLNKKYNNGYLGSYSKSQLPSVFGIDVLKQLLIMKVNQISPLVETDTGILWILKLDAVQESRIKTFDESQNEIHNLLGNQQTALLENEIIEKIVAKLGIKFR